MQEATVRVLLAQLKPAPSRKWTHTACFSKLTPPFQVFCPSRIAVAQNAFSTSSRLFDHVEPSPNATKPKGSELDQKLAEDKEKQIRTPWHRDGSDKPPVARQFSAGAMTKGKLLTTPSRLLKLILPLTTLDHNSDRKDVEPLALLVHPQQPLSYLERLIQSELPSIRDKHGNDKIPAVYFRAEDSMQDEIQPKTKTKDEEEEEEEEEDASTQEHEPTRLEQTRIDGKMEQTGVLSRPRPGEGNVETYSGSGRESTAPTPEGGRNFVRWSTSTEIGDFIRDAARGKEFAVEIEGASKEIRVGVPSFNDRTHYMRSRLRKTAQNLMDMATIKKKCDRAAHKSAQRIALGGLGVLVGWWYVVYRLTFETSLGWDTMEPVTYLVGLSAIVAGYAFFLVKNREVSYRSALNMTISARQTKLYRQHGFDLARWEGLVEQANALRREIRAVAEEYDVEWDELTDAKDEGVVEAMNEARDAQEGGEDGDGDKGDGGGKKRKPGKGGKKE